MILSRILMLPQERFDLEDLNALLSASRTDSKLFVKEFIASTNLIMKGFSVTGIGLKVATVNMTDATLMIPQSTTDFSWFTAAPGTANVVIPDVDIVDNTRNYIEIEILTQDGTPLTKAFWDPDANNGDGAEFSQIVNTMTDLTAQFTVSTGGFSGSGDRVPLCIIDTDSSGNIKTILDQRSLFGRLAKPSNIDNSFTWGTKVDPVYSLTLTAQSGTFVAGETLTIGAETATVVTGGTTSITFDVPSGINFFPGDSVTGGTSGATGMINTVSESFSGVDKSLPTLKDNLDALKTEFKAVKGTRFWWQDAPGSISGLFKYISSLVVPFTSSAQVSWISSVLKITDSNGSPLDTDVLAKIRIFGTNQQLNLTREDGTGGSGTITLTDGQVMFVKLPATGDRTYSAVGSGDTNYQITSMSTFVQNDSNFWLAYREGGFLFFRGTGELKDGEDSGIGDSVPRSLLDILGLADEVTPANFTTVSSGSLNLPNFNTTNGESFVDRMSKLTAMLADVRQDLNIQLDSGSITWDGTTLSITGASLSIPGTTVGASAVSINTFSGALAANSCVYVDISRSSGSALTLASSTLALLTPSEQRLIVARNVGGNILTRAA